MPIGIRGPVFSIFNFFPPSLRPFGYSAQGGNGAKKTALRGDPARLARTILKIYQRSWRTELLSLIKSIDFHTFGSISFIRNRIVPSTNATFALPA